MEEYMLEALSEAQKAYDGNEVPIGCVVVCGGRIIAREHNTKIADNDSLRHAELKALTAAQKILKTKYLYDCELYVTVEPCAMCAGAMINARLGKLFYALKEPKTGCCGSVYNLLEDGKFNHTVKVSGGMMEDKALILMQKFFREKRGQDE